MLALEPPSDPIAGFFPQFSNSSTTNPAATILTMQSYLVISEPPTDFLQNFNCRKFSNFDIFENWRKKW